MQVYLFDEFGPETSAMLQALYSRSSQSVTSHVEKVRSKGPDKFMASYYVGYGHASIGDCGVTTLYIEDVSLLACKAIQDTALYSGQETSTRYIDFSSRRIHDPIGSSRSEALQRRWLSYYDEIADEVSKDLKRRFPFESGQNPATWEKAIAARSFDIRRGLLPAGVTSQLSWTTNLRQAHEQIQRLESHPLAEMRGVGAECRRQLTLRYPNSFSHKVDDAANDYLRHVGSHESYLSPEGMSISEGCFETSSSVDNARLEEEVLSIIRDRPRRAGLPKSLSRFGRFECRFLLDFGSFRDLQRHRGGFCRMPLLTSNLGYHSWYLAQLPSSIREKTLSFIEAQLSELEALDSGVPALERQYFIPIGMNVACEIIYDLPEMVYVAELRSGDTVHPTLRWVAQQMGTVLRERHPQLALYVDNTEDGFSVRRGSQDIIERQAVA